MTLLLSIVRQKKTTTKIEQKKILIRDTIISLRYYDLQNILMRLTVFSDQQY